MPPPAKTTDAYAERTIAAYRAAAKRAIANWGRSRRPSRFLREFAAILPRRARVLDYGCGIGTELAWLQAQGFQAEGIDGALEFVLEARRRNPGLPIRHARFETVPLAPAAYDGIWCQAALIHVPTSVLHQQLAKLQRALMPGGLLGITLAWGRHKGLAQRDWIPGRYIAAYTKVEALAFFRDWHIHAAHVTSHDGRQGRWIQLLATSASDTV